MVDANHAYDAVSARYRGLEVEEYDIGWFEELVPDDLTEVRAVRGRAYDPDRRWRM